jgi:hypothetical protein
VNFVLTRKLIIFGLLLPLAAIIGFQLASPDDSKTFLLMGLVTGVLLMPIMLKWYHPLLVFAWNAAINVYFLPGKPQLWMLLTAIGFGIVVLNSTLLREKQAINVPALTIPLLFFLAVVLLTGKLTGGMGVRALGGAQIGGGPIGGKGYFVIMFALLGYFVLTSQPIPVERVRKYVSLFFLSGVTGAFSNLAYTLGPAFYFLFYLFPVDMAMSQAVADFTLGTMKRFHGIAVAGSAVYFYLMLRFGIRGIFDLDRPWRLLAFLLTVLASLFGGYRSLLITAIVHFAIQFYFERLVRTRLCLFLLFSGLAGSALLLPFINKMPPAVQRCFAFIPGAPVSAAAKIDAQASTEWRLEMWSVVVPQIPKYLILGKGYALNPADLYLASQAERRGLAKSYEVMVIAGGYHNGPLSLLITFGIFGTLGFLWLAGAGIWALYRNYRYGDPALHLINTFLLAYFVMRVVVFMFLFGAIDSDLFRFTGILGLSMAINRGVRKPAESAPSSFAVAPQPAPA